MIKKSEESKLGDAPVVHPCIFHIFRGDIIILNTSGHYTKLLKVNATKKSIEHSKTGNAK